MTYILSHWPLTFICAAMIVLGLRLLRESRDPDASGVPDPIGVLLVAAVPALLSFAIIEGPSWGWSDPRVIVGFVLAALLGERLLGLLHGLRWPIPAAREPRANLVHRASDDQQGIVRNGRRNRESARRRNSRATRR